MKRFLLYVIVFMSQFAVAQNTTVTVFNSEDASDVIIDKQVVLKNAIKWNWTLLTRGVFMLNYERELKPWLSVEGGIGVCYRDLLFEQNNIFTSGNVSSDSEVASLRPAIEASIRFYPFQLDDMEGFYCSLGLLNKNYKVTSTNYDESFDFSYNIIETKFLIGWQYDSFWIPNVLADFYFGVGLRDYHNKFYEYDKNNDSSSNDLVFIEKNGSLPALYAGWKISVPF